MKKNILFGAISILCMLSITAIAISAAGEPSYSWYCLRNKNHLQPIMDKKMSWIEEYDGYYIDHAHGDQTEEKVIYLTFDAGYENGNIERILNILAEEKVCAAFFILGNLIHRAPQLVIRMANDGHLICNHTNHHPDMTKKEAFEDFQKEIKGLEDLYQSETGRELSKYYRPPEGKFNQTSLQYAQKLGYKTIFWSFAYEDWDNLKQPDPNKATQKILDHVHNGAVLLLHPTSSTNAAILQNVIQALKAQGYRFGSLDELTNQQIDKVP